MNLIQHKCQNCAAVLLPQNDGRWKCRNCGSMYDVETVEKHTKQMQELFDREEAIAAARK